MKPETEFKIACKNKDFNAIVKIMERDNCSVNWGLKYACYVGQIDVINYMIEKGAYRLNLGLNMACKGGQKEVVDMMIKNGAHIDGESFFWACYGGNIDIINVLMNNDNKKLDINYGLFGACNGGHMDIVDLMLKKGAIKFNEGFDQACLGGHMDVVQFMIDNMVTNKIVINYNVGLEKACLKGHYKIACLMVELGANNFDKTMEIACYGIDLPSLKRRSEASEKICSSRFLEDQYVCHTNDQLHLLPQTKIDKLDKYNAIITLMIEKNAQIDYRNFLSLSGKNMLYSIIYSNKIKYHNKYGIQKIISIQGAMLKMGHVLVYGSINEKMFKRELLTDYKNDHTWKPQRHYLFPSHIKNNILCFMISIKIFMVKTLGQIIPKPLLWIIINKFVFN